MKQKQKQKQGKKTNTQKLRASVMCIIDANDPEQVLIARPMGAGDVLPTVDQVVILKGNGYKVMSHGHDYTGVSPVHFVSVVQVIKDGVKMDGATRPEIVPACPDIPVK